MLWRWLIITVSVWVATYIVPGLSYDNWQSLLVAALVLGLLNAFLKPILVLFSLPVVILTMGLFLLIINAVLLLLTAHLVKGFHVADFWSALGASVIISVVSLILGQQGRVVARRASAPPPAAQPRKGPPPGNGPIIDV